MNSEKSCSSNPSADLAWEAFRYVSEDMAPDEIAAFESRLDTDQTAREAVASAMRLTDGLWMATAMESWERPATPLGSPTCAPTRPLLWPVAKWLFGTAIAASCAFIVGWWAAISDSETPAVDVAQSRPHVAAPNANPVPTHSLSRELDGAGQLLEIWTSSEALVAELAAGPAAEWFEADPADETPLLASAPADEEAFGWMLAVLSPENSGPEPSPEPAVMEN